MTDGFTSGDRKNHEPGYEKANSPVCNPAKGVETSEISPERKQRQENPSRLSELLTDSTSTDRTPAGDDEPPGEQVLPRSHSLVQLDQAVQPRSPAEAIQRRVQQALRQALFKLVKRYQTGKERLQARLVFAAKGRNRRQTDLTWLWGEAAAGFMAGIILIPQALAFAMLAGLPPYAGLSAAIFPLLLYSMIGSIRALSVGPMVIIAFLVSTTLSPLAASGSQDYLGLAMLLALLTGLTLTFFGLARLGILLNFLSRPMMAGAITMLAVMIMIGQLPHFLGVFVSDRESIPQMLRDMGAQMASINAVTLLMGLLILATLLLRPQLADLIRRVGGSRGSAELLSHGLPFVVMLAGLFLVAAFQLDLKFGIATIAPIPAKLPVLAAPELDGTVLQALLPGALLIALIAAYESRKVAQPMAARQRQSLSRSRELMALGAANLGAGLVAGFPVAASAERSRLSELAGVRTRVSVFVTLVVLTLSIFALAPLSPWLPKVVLAAIILVAAASAIDIAPLRVAWRYNRWDIAGFAGGLLAILLFGIEWGLAAVILASVGLYLWQTARPQLSVLDPHAINSEERADVLDLPDHVLVLALHDNLNFANTAELERQLLAPLAARPDITHLVLDMRAVKRIDGAAFEGLQSLFENVQAAGGILHLAGISAKQRLRMAALGVLESLAPGRVYLTPREAIADLKGKKRADCLAELAKAEAVWSEIADKQDADLFRDFVAHYPSSPYAKLAAEKRSVLEDRQAWTQAEAEGSIASYQNYLASRKGDFAQFRGRAKARIRALRPVDPVPYMAAAVLLFTVLSAAWVAARFFLSLETAGQERAGKTYQLAAGKTDARLETSSTKATTDKPSLPQADAQMPQDKTQKKERRAAHLENMPESVLQKTSAHLKNKPDQVKPRAKAEPVSIDKLTRREKIAKIQFLLKELGYRVGAVDGKLGAQTRRNIKYFLDKLKVRDANDKLSPALIEALLAAKLEQEKRWNKWSEKLPDVESAPKPSVSAPKPSHSK